MLELLCCTYISYVLAIIFWRLVILAFYEVTEKLCVHSKAVFVDQAAAAAADDFQNTGLPSVLDTKRINRYPHLQPLDACYDILCDPYTYQVRT